LRLCHPVEMTRRSPAETQSRPSVAYLGPEGTFSEEALLSSARTDAVTPLAQETIYDAASALARGHAQFAIVPIENSIEGSITITLDTLVADHANTRIVAEVLLPVRHCLIARERVALEQIQSVLSHPHVPGQCTRFLRSQLAHTRVSAASSTAEAVRLVAQGEDPTVAAIGTGLAAEIYGCEILCEGIEDRADNETRFVWLAPADCALAPPLRERGGAILKTSLVFWGQGAGSPGWLVGCLQEFSDRAINLTKIESRPHRERSWRYMFFLDIETQGASEDLQEAIGALEGHCEEVRVLGSYPAAKSS